MMENVDGSVPHQSSSARPCNIPADPQCPPASKKRAVDPAPEDSANSPDDVVEMDQVAFTPVTYKKKRNAGIPVVFQPTAVGCSFWRVNPNILAAEVVTAAQEKVLTHRLNKDGSLMVPVSSLAAVNRLLQISSLAGITIETRVPHSYMATYGRTQGVPLEYTDEDLGNYLRSQGVKSARRHVSYRPNDDSIVSESRRRSVILEFKSGSALPERVFLGFCSFPVTEYMGSATQCFKCQRHGDIAKNCRGPVRCKICAGAHPHKDCTSRTQPHCANCGGPHPASYGACPKKKAATLARSVEQIQGKALNRREPPPNPEVVFTSVTTSSNDPPPQSSLPPNKSYAKAAQERTQPKASQNTPDASKRSTLSPQRRPHKEHGKTAHQSTQDDVVSFVIPMLFAAIRALLRANPSSKSFPEVEAVLALEPLISSSFETPQRGFEVQQ